MERYTEVCGDNRFELIKKYKEKLIEATNVETSKEEMAVIDNILFRFWQMGWLDKLEADVVPRSEVEKFIQEIDQIQKDKADVTYLKEQLVTKAKQEVAREIFEEIEKLLAHHSHTCVGYSENIGSFYYEKQLGNSIDELKKKYIGKKENKKCLDLLERKI